MARTALINVMTQAALKAGRALVRDFGEVENLQVSVKGPGDFVAAAGRRANQMLVAELRKARPAYGFLTQENGEIVGSDSGSRWVVDPLDGAVNFLHGIPLFAIAVALEREGKIVAAVVYGPIFNELYVAERGTGAYLNDRRLRVATRNNLAESLIGVPMTLHGNLAGGGTDATRRLQAEASAKRSIGSPALELAWIASGRYDGFWHDHLEPWNTAAGTIIVREAGGFVTDIKGNEKSVDAGSIVAGNKATHEQLLSFLALVPAK